MGTTALCLGYHCSPRYVQVLGDDYSARLAIDQLEIAPGVDSLVVGRFAGLYRLDTNCTSNLFRLEPGTRIEEYDIRIDSGYFESPIEVLRL